MPVTMTTSTPIRSTIVGAPEVIATNTLTLTNLNITDFTPGSLAELRSVLESFGDIYQFSPLKSFVRVIVVFYKTMDAQKAKVQLDGIEFAGKEIRVRFGQHTSIYTDSSKFLHVPKLEKNWLVSPPGSPPVGWTQAREDPPNSQILADDLVEALAGLGHRQRMNFSDELESELYDDEFSLEPSMFKFDDDFEGALTDFMDFEMGEESTAARRRIRILTITHKGADDELPIITVEDWDAPIQSKSARSTRPAGSARSNFPKASLLQRPSTPKPVR